MMMHKALHPKDNVNRLCQKKKEEEDLPSLKTALTQRFEDDIKKAWRKTDYSHQKYY